MSTLPITQVNEAPKKDVQSGHAVQFYETDAALIEAVERHISPALESGGTAIVVATPAHREGLTAELEANGIDTTVAAKTGRYILLDAAQMLATFMVNGVPDAQKFADTVGALVAQADASTSPGQRIAIFGEMVALLWAQGKREATVRLEELWNELAQRHSFLLLCGYPLGAFDRLEHRRLFFHICGEHTHVNPAESYPSQGNEKQRRRSVARLQQKAQALETEIRLSQERILMLQNATSAGTWELDLMDDTISLSATAARLLGIPSRCVPMIKLLDVMYYSGDRDVVASALQQARKGRKEFLSSFRVERGGETRLLEIRGKTVYNGGAPLILGVVSDVTPAHPA